MYSWWLPRVGRTSSDARKHRATSQRLRLFFFHCYPKIYVSLFREKKKREKPGRTIFDIYDSFRNFFLRKFQSFVAFRRMKESRIRIKNRYSIETSNVGKIGWTIGWEGRMEKDGGWNGLDACVIAGREMERKGRPGTKPSLADRCYIGGETRGVPRERGTLFSVGWVRAWNRCTLEKAYIPYTSFSRCQVYKKRSEFTASNLWPRSKFISHDLLPRYEACAASCVLFERTLSLSLSLSFSCKMIRERIFRSIFPISKVSLLFFFFFCFEVSVKFHLYELYEK